MDALTLFGKLQEHEMELKRLVVDEEGEKKNKCLALKVEESNFDGNVTLIVNKFKRFLRMGRSKNKRKKKMRKNTFRSNMLQLWTEKTRLTILPPS